MDMDFERINQIIIDGGDIVNIAIAGLYGLLLVALLFKLVRYIVALASGDSDTARERLRGVAFIVVALFVGASLFAIVFFLLSIFGLDQAVEVPLPVTNVTPAPN